MVMFIFLLYSQHNIIASNKHYWSASVLVTRVKSVKCEHNEDVDYDKCRFQIDIDWLFMTLLYFGALLT